MIDIKLHLKQLAINKGASLTGIANSEKLADYHFSDPEYLLPGAKSVLVFAVPIDTSIISDYLAKTSFAARDEMSRHEGEIYHKLWKIGATLTEYLQSLGYETVNAWPNRDYREFKSGEKVSNPFNLTPEFSHRFAAAAAGLGSFGWSSNIITQQFGAAVYFSSVITAAFLEPDPPLKDSPCDQCKLCSQVCQVGFVKKGGEEQQIQLGSKIFSHGMNDYIGKCVLCCGGWVNHLLYPSWTNFSPLNADFSFPDDPVEFQNEYRETARTALKGPDGRMKRNFEHHIKLNQKGMHQADLEEYKVVCAYCQLICWGDKINRLRNVKLVQKSGVVKVDNNNSEVIIREGNIIDRKHFLD